MKKLGIRILSNGGYGMDQVKGISLGELKEFVDKLFEVYGDDVEIVTVDDGNTYGARYGRLYLDIIEDEDEDSESEEW